MFHVKQFFQEVEKIAKRLVNLVEATKEQLKEALKPMLNTSVNRSKSLVKKYGKKAVETSGALRVAEKSRLHIGGEAKDIFKVDTSDMSRNELLKLYNIADQFLSSSSSTVTGIEQANRKRQDTLIDTLIIPNSPEIFEDIYGTRKNPKSEKESSKKQKEYRDKIRGAIDWGGLWSEFNARRANHATNYDSTQLVLDANKVMLDIKYEPIENWVLQYLENHEDNWEEVDEPTPWDELPEPKKPTKTGRNEPKKVKKSLSGRQNPNTSKKKLAKRKKRR